MSRARTSASLKARTIVSNSIVRLGYRGVPAMPGGKRTFVGRSISELTNEAPEDLRYPGYFREQSTLFEAGLRSTAAHGH